MTFFDTGQLFIIPTTWDFSFLRMPRQDYFVPNFSFNFSFPFLQNNSVPIFSPQPSAASEEKIFTLPEFKLTDNYSFKLLETPKLNIPPLSFASTKEKTKSKSSYTSTYRGTTFIPIPSFTSVDNSYYRLSRNSALQKAKNDSRLENLSAGGRRWQISEGSFRTDIPFAKKGTGKILDKVASQIGVDLVVTSALGTGSGSPHQLGGYKSHHNAENPKLDLRIPAGMSSNQFAQKLRNTGYFSHILNEGDHLDVQIDPSKYKSMDTLA